LEFWQSALEGLVGRMFSAWKEGLLANKADLFQIIRFAISGLSSTLVYFVFLNLLVLSLALNSVLSSVLAYAASVVFYYMQSRFTFRVDVDSKNQVIKFSITVLFGFIISFLSVYLFSSVFCAPYYVGGLVVCFVLPVANYFIFKRWVFKKLGV
jgi:putative flippase GtrA